MIFLFLHLSIEFNLVCNFVHFFMFFFFIFIYVVVFLTTEMNSSRQKLIQSIQMDLGDLQTQASISISYYVMSLIDGNIELVQKLWYQMDAVQYEQSAHIQKTLTTSLSFDSTPVTAKLQNGM